MPSFKLALLLLLSLPFSGCAVMARREPPPPPPPPLVGDARYGVEDLDGLLEYGAELARMDDIGRLRECEHVLQFSRGNQSLGVKLHLALAQSLTDACGEVDESLALLRSAKDGVKDAKVRDFLDLQERMLTRYVDNLASKNDLAQKLKKLIRKADESQRLTKSRETELKTLKEKLDALKSIEQNLGDSPPEQ